MRDRKEAMQWGRARVGDYGWPMLCLRFVRSCYDMEGYYNTASEAWNGARFKHPTGDYSEVPRYVPFFFETGYFDHIVFTLGLDSSGYRLCLSNDVKSYGRIDIIRMSSLAAVWNCAPKGWTEDLNGNRVYTKPRPKPVRDHTPHFDRIVKQARAARKANDGGARRAAERIIDLAKPHSSEY